METLKMLPLEEVMRGNADLKKSDIDSLREWCQKQPHLPHIADTELALFLHSNYYSLEGTKKTLDTFFTVRTHVPEIFSNRNIQEAKDLKKIIKITACTPLQQKTKDGYSVLYSCLTDPDPTHYDYAVNMKLVTMIMDLWLNEEGMAPGHIIVVDIKGAVMGHLAHFSPMTLKRFLFYLQEGLPIRLKGFHFVNINPVMDILMNMMRPFMKKELLDILHLHESIKGIEEFDIPLDIFPTDAGGKMGNIPDLYSIQLDKIVKHHEWFLEEEKIRRVEESKRPGKSITATDLFGAEGSFKKLEID